MGVPMLCTKILVLSNMTKLKPWIENALCTMQKWSTLANEDLNLENRCCVKCVFHTKPVSGVKHNYRFSMDSLQHRQVPKEDRSQAYSYL